MQGSQKNVIDCLAGSIHPVVRERDQVFVGKTNGSSCGKSQLKPFIRRQSDPPGSVNRKAFCHSLKMHVFPATSERDQVFVGKTNGSSCGKSRHKPLIQPHSSTRAARILRLNLHDL